MGKKTEMPTAIRITWPHGETVEARSATEFILRTAKAQWTETSFQEMKDQLSRRAQGYPGGSQQFIHPHQPDEAFLRELFRVGMFTEMWEDGVKLERREDG
jgi:hypothetical protein